PLNSSLELQHRIRLITEACNALKRIDKNTERLTVLDVGCGVGRSSRVFVDLGILPHNMIGIDIRESAIEFAQKINPAIQFRTMDSLDDWPIESVDLCIQCTVFSSIPGNELRNQ